MKRKDYTIYLVVLLTASAILFAGYRYFTENKHTFKWHKTYADELNEPYDFGLFKTLLEHKAKDGFTTLETPASETLSEYINGGNTLYVFAGRDCYMSKQSTESLLKFVGSGQQAILIAEAFPDTLLKAIAYRYGHFKTVRFNAGTVHTRNAMSRFGQNEFRFMDYGNDSTRATDWYYLEEGLHAGDPSGGYTTLHFIRPDTDSSQYGKLNHAVFRLGKGTLYLHTSPMLFSNYALRREQGFRYVNSVFKGLHASRVVYDAGARNYTPDASPATRESDAPLAYILKQPSLRMAWYLFLSAAVVFLVLGTGRKQKAIPVISRKQNSSVQFVQTLGQLYKSEADYKKTGALCMQLFQHFIKHRLQLQNTHGTPENIRLISLKSGVPEHICAGVFDTYKTHIEVKKAPGEKQLIELHKSIQAFYTHYYKTNQ